MALLFVSELIDMAVKDEETGVAFYKALAQTARNPRIRERLLAISKQEEAQLAWFEKMSAEIGREKLAEQYTGEQEDYLRALTSRAFPDSEAAAALARSAEGDAEAIDMAMRLEKDTLLLLTEMKRFLPQKHGKYVDVVIDEEKEHLVDLNALKKLAG